MLVDQASAAQPDALFFVQSSLKLPLMVIVAMLFGLVSAPDIHHNIKRIENVLIPSAHDFGVLKLLSLLGEHGASQHFVAVEDSVVGAYAFGVRSLHLSIVDTEFSGKNLSG